MSLRAIGALALREMATRYGRSPGGYIWAVLEPVCVILILSVGLSLIVRHPPLGDNFILFFATAFLPFSFYSNVSGNVSRSVNFSRALLFYPAVNWLDAVLARFVLNSLTETLVALLILVGFLAFTDIQFILETKLALLSLGLTIFLALGVGILNCALTGLFPIWTHIWSILTRPLFLISGVFFLYEGLPGQVQWLLWCNPLLHITGIMRAAFYPNYVAEYASPLFVLAVGLVCLFLGLILMARYHRDILIRG